MSSICWGIQQTAADWHKWWNIYIDQAWTQADSETMIRLSVWQCMCLFLHMIIFFTIRAILTLPVTAEFRGCTDYLNLNLCVIPWRLVHGRRLPGFKFLEWWLYWLLKRYLIQERFPSSPSDKPCIVVYNSALVGTNTYHHFGNKKKREERREIGCLQM